MSRIIYFFAAAILLASLASTSQLVHANDAATLTPTGEFVSIEPITETITPATEGITSTPPPTTDLFTPTQTASQDLFTPTPSPSKSPTSTEQVDNFPKVRILVKSSNSASLPSSGGITGQITLNHELSKIGVVVLEVPQDQVDQTIANLETSPGVHYAEPDQEMQALETIPNDPGWVNQGDLISIHAPQGWDYTTGSNAVTIAIIDTGIDLSHPEFAGRIIQGYDFVNNDPIAQDDHGHGTHVAGIAAAAGNNGIGIAGVSWKAMLLPVKVLDSSGGGSYSNVAGGIIWATDHGAQVINMSLGGSKPSQVLDDAIQYAAAHGVILVAAAGNSGTSGLLYPARYQPVIAVGAVDNAGNHAAFSNNGPELALVAPGISIYSTLIGGYGTESGTSMSTPLVSGLAAILRGLPLGTSAQAVTWEMESTALDLGSPGLDNYYGYGMIQMDAAIRLAIHPKLTPTTSGNSGAHKFTSTPYISFLNPTAIRGTNTPTPTVLPLLTPAPTYEVGIAGQNQPWTQTTTTPTPTQLLSIITTELPPIPQSEKPGSYLLPCLGIGLILSGLLLAWVAHRSSNLH